MTVTLRSHNDIANAFVKLGLGADVLETRKGLEKALDAVKEKDPMLVRALEDVVLDGMKGGERDRLAAFIGAASTGRVPQSGVGVSASVGGAGVNRFALDALLDKKGRLQANLPEVAQLLQRYRVDGPVDRPFERVLVHTAKIDEILRSEPDADKLVDLVMSKDLRRQVFLLEGISKLYSDIHGKKAEAVYDVVKKLEDQLGHFSMTKSNLATAEKVGADPAVVALLRKDMESSRAALKDLLVDEWVPDAKGRIPALRDVVEEWGEAKWGSYEKDVEKVKGELSRRLSKLEATPYDMKDLENGVHELRRQLRWFPIYAESLNGLFQLDDTTHPIKAYEPLLSADIAKSKYVQLPDAAREQDPINVSKSVYCGLMQLTLDLGALKDSGEPIHFIRDAYVRAGVSRDAAAAEKAVAKLFTGVADEGTIHADAQRLYDAMKKNGLVRELRNAVENG
jgi:polyhydroxyalkanoate synthesis regulator phasin